MKLIFFGINGLLWLSFFSVFAAADNTPYTLENMALQHGLLHKHTQRSHHINGLHDTLGAGACALDVDNDGWMDLFFVGGQGQTREYGKDSWWSKRDGHHLYRNNRNGYFSDASSNLIALPTENGMGCHAVDIDLDGDTDLIISGFKNTYLLHNNKGQLTRINLDLGQAWTTGITIIDANQDGLPDIYITGYLNYQYSANVLETQSGFKTGELAAFKANNFKGQRNFLFINQGNLSFKESAQDFQVEEPESRSVFTTIFNANNDAWPDLFIANDNGSQSIILVNQQGHGFLPAYNQLPLPKNTFSLLSLADTPQHNALWFNTQNGQLPALLKFYYGAWQDRIWRSLDNHNAIANANTFSSAAIDMNADGETDIALANGLLSPDEDSYSRTKGQANNILLNKNGVYTPINPFSEAQSSRTVISIDIDNDGDKDLLFTNNNAIAELYITPEQPKTWIGVTFNKKEIFDIKSINIHTSQRELNIPWQINSFLGSHDPRFSQILKPNEVVNAITINYYKGHNHTLKKPLLNRYITNNGSAVIAANALIDNNQPYVIARWKLIAKKLNPNQTVINWGKWPADQQLSFLDDLLRYDESHAFLGTVIAASYSHDEHIVLKSLSIFKQWEDELSTTRLLNLLASNNKHIRCQTANVWTYFYQEEESMVESKHLAMPLLIRNAIEQKDTCAIKALSYSRDTRPVIALNNLLNKNNDAAVTTALLYALAELRHESSIAAIQSAIPHFSPNEITLAKSTIHRIKGTLQELEFTPELSPHCKNNNALRSLLEHCDNSVLINLLSHNQNLRQSFIKNLYDLTASNEKKAILLTGIEGNNASSLLIKVINDEPLSPRAEQSLHILAFLQAPTFYIAHLQTQFLNTSLPISYRIALGNVLVHHDAEWVLSHSTGFFNAQNR